jgi:aryl-alcohol dehydrogenase-like predicted oxidoreductase
MEKQVLGQSELKVSRLGLGCMSMAEFYGSSDPAESIRVLHRALDLGINFFDTADLYGFGKSEELLRRAFEGKWNRVVLATKFGILRDEEGGITGRNARPEYVKQACEASLKRLGKETLDLYYLHRLDPEVPVEDTVGAMAELVKAGKVRTIGISEVDADTLRRAHKVHPVTALQNEFSLWSREPENETLSVCRELKIGLVAYSPLGRGFLAGAVTAREDLKTGDRRLILPRFEQQALEVNQKFTRIIGEIADGKSVTPAQVALAWVLQQGDDVFPIPGTKKITRLEENVAALDISLSSNELALIDEHLPLGSTEGGRY